MYDDVDFPIFDDGQPQLDELDHGGRSDGSIVFDNSSKKFVSTGFAQNYLFRGDALKMFSPYEYAGVITVRAMTAAETLKFNPSATTDDGDSDNSDDDNDDSVDNSEDADDDPDDSNAAELDEPDACPRGRAAAVGRKCNGVVRFDPKHSLYSSHVQQLRSLHRVPIIAGAQMLAPSKNASKAEKNRFAACVITLHVESRFETGLPAYPLTYDGLLQLVSDLRGSSSSFAKCRLRWIQLRFNDSINSQVMKMIRSWRHQFTYRTDGEFINEVKKGCDDGGLQLSDDALLKQVHSDLEAYHQHFNIGVERTAKELRIEQSVSNLSAVHAQVHIQMARADSAENRNDLLTLLRSELTQPQQQQQQRQQQLPPHYVSDPASNVLSVAGSRLDFHKKNANIGAIYSNLKRGVSSDGMTDMDETVAGAAGSHVQSEQGLDAIRSSLLSLDHLDPDPDPVWQLNAKQSEIFTLTCSKIDAMRRYRASPTKLRRPDEFLLDI